MKQTKFPNNAIASIIHYNFSMNHMQVSGKVYAVDEYTFLLSGFNYDGNGADTFFWSGASNRPGPQGFIVPDEYGK